MREKWEHISGEITIYFDKSEFTQEATHYVTDGKIQFANNDSCVYKIVNMDSGKVYIGTTQEIISRIHGHYGQLLKGKHFCKEMQKDFLNGDVFQCTIISRRKDFETEQEEIHKCIKKGFPLYNACIAKERG